MENEQYQIKRNKLTRILFVISGSISLTIGIIGIFVPLLPTTVFLLISAYCYVRSSPKLYNWLINHKYLGTYISNYRRYKAMPKKAKISAISLLWITIIISGIIVDVFWIRIVLLVVAISITAYILSIKTLTDEHIQKIKEQYGKIG